MSEDCLEALSFNYSRLRVSRITAELEEPEAPAQAGRGARLGLIVKDRHGISIDEAPIVEAVESAATRLGLIVDVYSYEVPGRSRSETLASVIQNMIESGRPFAALLPNVMVVPLVGSLSEAYTSALESSYRISLRVEHTNILYLPKREATRAVEIVGKMNSAASYERARRLQDLALREGLLVKRQIYLDSNHEILDYVVEAGRVGPLTRVPVTKLALVSLSVFDCLSGPLDSPVNEYVFREEASHSLLLYRVPAGLVDAIIEEVEAVREWSPSREDAWRFADSMSGVLRILERLLTARG